MTKSKFGQFGKIGLANLSTFHSIMVAFFIIIVLLVAAGYMEMQNRSDKIRKCQSSYIGKFASAQEEYFISLKCQTKTCGEFGLLHSIEQNSAKAIVYCQIISGARIKVEMPQDITQDNFICQNYFSARWDQARCFREAGLIEGLI